MQFAEDDLAAGLKMVEDPATTPRHVCLFAQQAAEKAIKAAMVFLGLDVLKTHDLDRLRTLLPKNWRVRRQWTDLSRLTEWAAESRYPGEWADPTPSDARQALDQAGAVLDAIKADIAEPPKTSS
jgi:HEPN domain-containing protein